MPLFGQAASRKNAEILCKATLIKLRNFGCDGKTLMLGKLPPNLASGLGITLDEAIAADPTYLPARHMRAMLQISERRFEEAESDLRNIVHNPNYDEFASIMPPKWDVYTSALFAAARAGKVDTVLTECETALAQNPGFISGMKELAGMLGASGQPDATEKIFKKIVERNPQDAEAHWMVVISLEGQKKWYAAEESIKRLMNSNPSDGRLHYHLGVCLVQQGQLEQGAIELETSLRGGLDADELKEAKRNYAILMGRLGRPVTQETRAAAPSRDGRPYINAAMEALNRRDTANAISLTLEAIKAEPNEPNYHAYLGTLLAGQGRNDEAEVSYNNALLFNDRHCLARLGKGELLYNKGRLQEAIAEYRIALQDAGADPELYKPVCGSLAQAYQALGDTQSAQYYASLKE